MATVLHVGFNKTGTTTLQGEVFPRLPDTAVLGPLNEGFDRFHVLARELCWADDGTYSDTSLRAMFDETRAGFRRLVVSLEDFSFWHHGGRTPRRLQALLPDARVLICVRDQRTLLYSKYGGWLRKGGPFGFARYLTKLDPGWLAFDVVVESYQQVFGVERVKVLPYELLVSDPSRYLNELNAFVAPDEPALEPVRIPHVANRGLAPATRLAVRTANRLFVRSVDNPHPPLAKVPRGGALPHTLERWDSPVFRKLRVPQSRRDGEVAERYGARYAANNTRLEQLTGLDLASYGYLVASPATVMAAPSSRR